MNRLPIELIDYIIDFHHSDRPTLKDCSLVCRKWFASSRFRLYRTVFIRPSNVHSFVELLVSPFATIASCVNTLYIHLQTTVVTPHFFDNIAPYLREFIAVKSITLLGWHWDPVSEENLSRGFGRIENMELTRVTNDFHGFFNFQFTLGDGGSSTFSSCLRILGSAFDGGNRRLSWLPIVAQLPTVGVINLYRIGDSHLPTMQATLTSGGQSIHTINLSFMLRYSVLGSISDCVDLSHNTNLRSLSIACLDLRKPGKIASGPSFHSILERISSFYLKEIRVVVWANDCADLTWLDCKKVAEELNNPRFAELQKVCIGVSCSGKLYEMAAWVREEMSCLANRGILTVC